MPIHDWSRVDVGVFHSFHGAWIAEMGKALNSGILPPDHYALGEQVAGRIGPDVLTLQAPLQDPGGGSEPRGTLTVVQTPPRVGWVLRTEIDDYAMKQRSLVIRHSSNDRIVALVEIVSPGNKSSRHAIRTFLERALGVLNQGIHFLFLDLFSSGPRDLRACIP